MGDTGQNKVYYNVNINYDEGEKDPAFNGYSKATTEIRLNGPLITDLLNYDLAISKFKIDTECLPLFIPEMLQNFSMIQSGVTLTSPRAFTAYKITLYYVKAGINDPAPNSENEGDNSDPEPDADQPYLGCYNKIENYVAIMANHGAVYSKQYPREMYEYGDDDPEHQGHRKEKGGKDTDNKNPFKYRIVDGNVFIDNTDPSCFFYDYQSFLDRINSCIAYLLSRYINKPTNDAAKSLQDELYKTSIKQAYFQIEDDQRISLNLSREFLKSHCLLKFSSNLYKLIGNGFDCKFYKNVHASEDNDPDDPGAFFINYNPFIPLHINTQQEDHDSINDDRSLVIQKKAFDDAGTQGNPNTRILISDWDTYTYYGSNKALLDYKDIDGVSRRKGVKITQQFTTLTNWNICKAILVCSRSLPIKGEFYPTAEKSFFLTHYTSSKAREDYRKLYNADQPSISSQIFDKAATKIVEVYYPLSSSPGDIRSTVIYSNDEIDSGNKIDFIGGQDLQEFDIYLKWVDIYGNVYDFYLAPGSSINIRLCFTRKKLRRDEVREGFNQVNEKLSVIADASVQTQAENNEHTFDTTMEPKRKRNKVQLPGVLENGMIMKP